MFTTISYLFFRTKGERKKKLHETVRTAPTAKRADIMRLNAEHEYQMKVKSKQMERREQMLRTPTPMVRQKGEMTSALFQHLV